MATRTRKSPRGKKGRRKPGLLLTGATAVGGVGLQGAVALGGVAARNPSITGGTVAFLVIFSFVAANALWYQPGVHPHPIFRTRDPHFPSAISGRPAPVEEQSGDVTMFKIERPDDAGAAQTTNATPAPAAPSQQPNQLVMDIQEELVRRGLYNGAPDGVIGPRTSAAILFFEETVGMAQAGDATPEVLAALRTDSVGPSTVPADKPREDVSSRAGEDPVAAAIRSAEKTVKTAPASAKQIPSSELTNVDLVLKIQKALSNMAYANVGVDGVAGEQTRTAIRHFQKHYNLPENGEPNEAVLKKLKEIGAL
jgi:peptidoglycan hydrolase-like protein with peptidoglycan-binding domain